MKSKQINQNPVRQKPVDVQETTSKMSLAEIVGKSLMNSA
jgi:hypothetical protein